MRIMFISTDRKLFTQGEVVFNRFAHMGERFSSDAFDSIVFSTKSHGFQEVRKLAPNTNAHPTNSIFRILYGLDAFRIATKLPRPDVVTAQDPFETGLIALCIARYWRVPLAVEMHTDFLSPSFRYQSLLNFIRFIIAKVVLKFADGGYVVSGLMKILLEKQHSLKTSLSVLPVFVDVAKFKSLKRTPAPGSVLWIGRFEAEKNPALALQAIATARKSGIDARLTMLGSGKLESSLKKLVERLGIKEYVTFPGWQDPAPYIAKAEIMFVTSEYEGYGMAIMEALAAGLPVLSTDVGIAREAGAIIIQGDCVGALISNLREVPKPGALRLSTYKNEGEYLDQLRSLYASIAFK